MDVLTDVLESLHVRNMLSGRLDLSAPWGLHMEPEHAAFYVVTRGNCWLRAQGSADPIQVAGGDYVLLPKAQQHTLDDRRSPVLLAAEVLKSCPQRRNCQPAGIFTHGGGGALTVLIGG